MITVTTYGGEYNDDMKYQVRKIEEATLLLRRYFGRAVSDYPFYVTRDELRALLKKQPMRVSGWTARYENGKILLGCQRVHRSTIKKLLAMLKPKKKKKTTKGKKKHEV